MGGAWRYQFKSLTYEVHLESSRLLAVDSKATSLLLMYLNAWEGRDLWSSSDEDVLGVYDLFSISSLRGHLILASYPSETIDVSYLRTTKNHYVWL